MEGDEPRSPLTELLELALALGATALVLPLALARVPFGLTIYQITVVLGTAALLLRLVALGMDITVNAIESSARRLTPSERILLEESQRPKARISIEREAVEGTAKRVRQLFEALGFDALVSADYGRKSHGPHPTVTHIETSARALSRAFLFQGTRRYGVPIESAGARLLREFLESLETSRGGVLQSGGIEIEDRDLNLQILLPWPLPPVAYVELLRVDFESWQPTAVRSDTLYWNSDTARWEFFMPEDPTRVVPRRAF
jgi:hypothetical protein